MNDLPAIGRETGGGPARPVVRPARAVVPALLVAAALVLAAVGCGADTPEVTSAASDAVAEPAGAAAGGPEPTVRAADDGSAILVRTPDRLRVVDPGTGAERFAAPGAMASGDGSVVAVAEPDGGRTVVRVRSVVDGSTRWETAVDGALEVAGVSRHGETVALTDVAAPAGSTTFVVVRFAMPAEAAGYEVPPELFASFPSARRYDVPGDVGFDAFSTSTATLFVLQRSTIDPGAYRVMMLGSATGVLEPMQTRDKVIPEGEMYGRVRASVEVSARGEVATLYTVGGAGSTAAGFVHLLNVAGSYADCLDLPEPLGRGTPSTVAIAAPVDGNPLYVVDTHEGLLARLDPNVVGSVRWDEVPALAATPDVPAAVAVAVDGRLVLAGGSDVHVVDPDSRIGVTWPAGGTVTDLATIPGTSMVVAVVDGEVRRFELSGTPAPGHGTWQGAEPEPVAGPSGGTAGLAGERREADGAEAPGAEASLSGTVATTIVRVRERVPDPTEPVPVTAAPVGPAPPGSTAGPPPAPGGHG